MEADFNANNKELIGSRMMANIRSHGLMMEEIFSEIGRTDGGRWSLGQDFILWHSLSKQTSGGYQFSGCSKLL
jgi:hypothetical protein